MIDRRTLGIAALGAASFAAAAEAAQVEGRVAPAAQTGPVRNQAARPGDPITTLRYFKIKPGTFGEFLAASQNGVWPYFEKIGARVVGMWRVVPAPGEAAPLPKFEEVYLVTRYASAEHWAATRDAAKLGGDGPDYQAMQAALKVRRDLTIETNVKFMTGVSGPLDPVFLPGTGERFAPVG